MNGISICRDEAQSYVHGFPGAKFKKFKALPEAEEWYRSNLPRHPVNTKTMAATPSTSTITPSSVVSTSLSNAGTTHASQNQPTTSVSKPIPQPISRATPIQPPRIAAPKNTTVDIVYSDGACKGNGSARAVAGIGVWWGHDDPRYVSSLLFLPWLISLAYKESIRKVPWSADK